MRNPNGGLSINQLVKMKCAGVISLEQFLAWRVVASWTRCAPGTVGRDGRDVGTRVCGTAARRASPGLVSSSLSMAIYMGDGSHL